MDEGEEEDPNLPSTLAEVFENILLPNALKCGVRIKEFWGLTYGEIILIIKTHNSQEKARAREVLISNYNLASMVSQFVGATLNGKKIPPLYELFPDALGTDKPKVDKNGLTKAEYNRAMMQKEMFIDFAIRRNKKLKGEGEKLNVD